MSGVISNPLEIATYFLGLSQDRKGSDYFKKLQGMVKQGERIGTQRDLLNQAETSEKQSHMARWTKKNEGKPQLFAGFKDVVFHVDWEVYSYPMVKVHGTVPKR